MKSNVRTFRAPSPREALDEVKRALGPDAVILGTRTIAGKGLGALAGRTWTEITAAPADTVSPGPRVRRTSGTRKEQSREAAVEAIGSAEPAKVAEASPVPRLLYPYYVQLVQNEVAEELAQRLIREAGQRVEDAGQLDQEELRKVVCEYIGGIVSPGAGVSTPAGRLKRLALIGPSGSGKTTTLAKLAARFALQEKRQVGILSLDLQHVGAHEHLRRYAEILNVPLFTAQTIGEVKECLRSLDNIELLLIDTPGVGLREDGRFARLATLLRAARVDETLLVLPASTAQDVLERMAAGFAPLGPKGLVLTRLDDVIGFGVVLNLLHRLKIKLSYISAGQNVPADLEVACGKRLAELVLCATG